MKSISELEKLYKISIPVHEEFDYYVQTLLKSKEYDFLPEAIKNLQDLENKTESVSKYKMQKMDQMIDYIKKSKTYEKFQNYDIQNNEVIRNFKTSDIRQKWFVENKNVTDTNPEYQFVSIDIAQANYTTMKCLFDTDNELYSNWQQFCEFFDLHPAISNSKSFRQMVFGNCNPSRNQSLQKTIIQKVLDLNKDHWLGQDIFISHDEIILAYFPRYEKEFFVKVKKMVEKTNISFKVSLFYPETIEGRKKIFIKNHLNDNYESVYRELVGVPGNQFFQYFKKYILKEEIENRDLLFVNDGKIAMWIDNYEPRGKLIYKAEFYKI